MKIRLEKGTLAAAILGGFMFGGIGLIIVYKPLTSFYTLDLGDSLLFLCLGLFFIFIGLFFIKLPMLPIVFSKERQEFIVPYLGASSRTWKGNSNFLSMALFSLFFYRKRIPARDVNYVVLCKYGDVVKLLQKLENDPQAIKKINEYVGPNLSPILSTQVAEGSIARGLGEGVTSGNVLDGGISGVASGAAGALILADAIKNNYLIGIRNTEYLLLFTIGYELRRGDCIPFASFLSTQNIKVITE